MLEVGESAVKPDGPPDLAKCLSGRANLPLPAGWESSFYQPLQPILAHYPGLTLVVAP